MTTLILMVLSITYAAAGLVAEYFGLYTPPIAFEFPIVAASSPGTCSGFFSFCFPLFANFIQVLTDILAYIINFLIQIFNLIIWPVMMESSAAPAIKTLGITLMILLAGLTIYKLARSGSDS